MLTVVYVVGTLSRGKVAYIASASIHHGRCRSSVGSVSYDRSIGTDSRTGIPIYLVNDAGSLVGRPILTACVDAYSGLCCG